MGNGDSTRIDNPGDEEATWVDQGGDATHLDGGGDRTNLDPGVVGKGPEGSGSSGQGFSPLALPPALAERFEHVTSLPSGSQAVPHVVRDRQSGELRLVKVYLRSPGEEYERILKAVRDADFDHLVRIYEFGTDGGYFWELQEYCEAGSLQALIDSGSLAGDPGLFRGVIAETSRAIAHLHSLREPGSREHWVHRDIKPANVLVRRLDPLDLVLCDFGLVKVIEGSVAAASSSATPLYASPEVLDHNSVSPARDWWALGMMVVEMATGHHPFTTDDGIHFSAFEIRKALVARPVDTSGIADAHTRLLARGLLTRDPEKRWTGEQVEAWLRGEEPPVDDPEHSAPPKASQAHATIQFDFTNLDGQGDVAYTSPAKLAEAMARDWERASEIIFGGQKQRSQQRSLREFVESCEIPDKAREKALKQLTSTEDDIYRRLFIFVRCLGPGLPPLYRGEHLEQRSLAALAAGAVGEDEPSREIVAGIYEDDPFPLLVSEGDQYNELFKLSRRWKALADEAIQTVGSLADSMRSDGQVPEIAELRTSAICLALLLVAEPDSRDQLLSKLRGMRDGDAARVSSWAEVADRALAGSGR